jgi:2-methylfumaryl-CoA isomerase
MMGEIDQPGVGRLLAPASPLDDGGSRMVAPAPALGENTDDLLAEIGADPTELRNKGVIA